MANQLWCVDFLTSHTPLIIPHRLPSFLESLMPLKKMLQKQSEVFYTFLWQFFQVWNRILLHMVLLKCPHIQIAFLKFTSCDNQALVGCIPIAAAAVQFECEIIKIGQSSHKMYSNKILNFQVSTTIFNVCTKKAGNLFKCTTYIHTHIFYYDFKFALS